MNLKKYCFIRYDGIRKRTLEQFYQKKLKLDFIDIDKKIEINEKKKLLKYLGLKVRLILEN